MPVHINRQTLHSLEVPEEFEADGPFHVDLINHGEAIHVHLHIGDDLSDNATIEANNHFVDGEARRRIPVELSGDGELPDRGKLKVVSSYGAETRYIDIVVNDVDDGDSGVEVDESLAKRQQPTRRSTGGRTSLAHDPDPAAEDSSRSISGPEVLVLGLGLVSVVIAVVAAIVIDSDVVLLGSLAVLAAVLVAMFLLHQR